MTAAIAIEHVALTLGNRTVLDDFSLVVQPGEVVALLGPSGSGKTSVLRLSLGFTAPTKGSVRLSGEVVSAAGKVTMPPEERGLAVVFQDLALWPHLTIRGNLAFGLASQKISRAVQDARIQEMLERVGLTARQNSYPSELSGGERQRVAIARALVLEPRAILLDEPLANLDVALKRELLAIFRELLKERRTTAVYVTHDLREAAALGDRIVVMENGRITQEGSLDMLRAQPATPFAQSLFDDLSWVGRA